MLSLVWAWEEFIISFAKTAHAHDCNTVTNVNSTPTSTVDIIADIVKQYESKIIISNTNSFACNQYSILNRVRVCSYTYRRALYRNKKKLPVETLAALTTKLLVDGTLLSIASGFSLQA